MAFEDVKTVWMNGRMVPFADARVHVFSHALHYGTGLFEGVRCYRTKRGPACFRLDDHLVRMFNGARIYRMEIPYTLAELRQATLEVIRENGFEECYIRPLVYRGVGTLGVNPFPSPVEMIIGAWKWGQYLGAEAIEQGVDVCVSSWSRTSPNTFPAMAKATANYMNSQLIKMEAVVNGFAEGIALDDSGCVAEGSGENIFFVWNGRLHTPALASSILPGVTRNSVIKIARDLGYEIREERIPRELLYIADEVFFCGTASEITPIRSVDRIPVRCGGRGPITERLQKEFFGIVRGDLPDRFGWLQPVEVAAPAAATGR
jgi:branched-chain amino acid aminotransferase